MRTIGACAAVLLVWSVQGASAGDGVVALQTADPPCPDDSGNIYVDCGNGTVTDNRTGLVWLANADCLSGGGAHDTGDWFAAIQVVAGLSDKPPSSAAAGHDCGLSDGSSPGEWRLPSVEEWEAMVADALGQDGDPDCTASPPTITNDSGLGCWESGPSSFSGVASVYWSSTSDIFLPTAAWGIALGDAFFFAAIKTGPLSVWPVRGGQ